MQNSLGEAYSCQFLFVKFVRFTMNNVDVVAVANLYKILTLGRSRVRSVRLDSKKSEIEGSRVRVRDLAPKT